VNKHLSTALELVGMGLLIWAFALVAIPLAIATAGLAALMIGFSIGDNK
jgi:hypothetical protein